MNISETADKIEGTDAEAILCHLPYRSFCNGSDLLAKVGLMNPDDGEWSEYAFEVLAELNQRRWAKELNK